MSTIGGFYYGFWEVDPRRWSRCVQEAASGMIAAGWNPHARKFHDVKMRKAHQLWRKP